MTPARAEAVVPARRLRIVGRRANRAARADAGLARIAARSGIPVVTGRAVRGGRVEAGPVVLARSAHMTLIRWWADRPAVAAPAGADVSDGARVAVAARQLI